jgi:hypothetical protein
MRTFAWWLLDPRDRRGRGALPVVGAIPNGVRRDDRGGVLQDFPVEAVRRNFLSRIKLELKHRIARGKSRSKSRDGEPTGIGPDHTPLLSLRQQIFEKDPQGFRVTAAAYADEIATLRAGIDEYIGLKAVRDESPTSVGH